ncbi:hypothetical protein MRX96_019834 [Rhipicephalus microplus]
MPPEKQRRLDTDAESSHRTPVDGADTEQLDDAEHKSPHYGEPSCTCLHSEDYGSDSHADSVISCWDLVCGWRWLDELSAIVAMLEEVTFIPAPGVLSDHVGRRPVILIAAGILISASAGMTFAETLPFFITA